MRENGILEKIIEFITSPDLQTTSNTTEAIINGFVNMAADSRVENTMIGKLTSVSECGQVRSGHSGKILESCAFQFTQDIYASNCLFRSF